MSKTIEEINKMREEAETKIGEMLTELAECGVYIGTVRTWQRPVDKDGDRLFNPGEGAKILVTADISLHLQSKPDLHAC